MEKTLEIEVPQEVLETLELFHETLESQGIRTTQEEVASFMLTEWCAKQAADIATFGDRTSSVPLFRTRENHLDSQDLFNLLKSDFMFENLYRADEEFRHKYREHLEQRGQDPEAFSLRMREMEREVLEILAKAHGLTLTDLLRKGARLLGEFSPGFLDTVNEHFNEYGVKASEVLEMTFQKVTAAVRAWQKVFDSDPPGALRQFKYQDNELIKGDDLSKILLSEYEELFQNLKSKLMDSTEKGEEVRISAEELSEFASML